MSDQAQDMTKFNRVYHQIVEDSSYRRKVLNSLAVYGIFAVINAEAQGIKRWYRLIQLKGGIKGQLGPAFLDLQSICDVGLEKGSWILTSLYIGYTLGALANGFLYHRCNGNLLFAVSALCLAVSVAAIPWCYMYSLMVAAHVITGLFVGLADAAGNAEIIRHWKTRSQTILVGLHVIFNVGGVISPLIIAPFLRTRPESPPVLNTTLSPSADNAYRDDNILNVSLNVPIYEMYHSTTNDTPRETSRVFIAYSVSSVFCLVHGCFFLILYILEKERSKNMRSKDDTKETMHTFDDVNKSKKNGGSSDPCATIKKDIHTKYDHVPKRFQFTGVGIMVAMAVISNAIDFSFSTYLSSFCVEFLFWSKAAGSFITSLLFIMVVCGGIAGMFLTKCINSIVYIGIEILLMLASLCMFLVSVNFKSTIGVWFSAPLLGFAKSAVFPLVIAWTNTMFMRVSGRISSIFFVGAMGGSAINLFVLAAIMEKIDKIWFGYVLIIESTVLIFFYISAVILTKHVKRLQTTNASDMSEMEHINHPMS